MKEIVIPPPSEKQKLFLTAKTKYIGFGGARGGGKSWSVRVKAILLALNYPGIRILIVRRTYPELINNHINIMRRKLLEVAKYNDKDKVLKFINGSTVNFAYCAKDGDLDRLQGVEYDVIFLDEATQLSEHQMKSITACVRGVNAFPKRVYYTCNPGGQGHQYIKRIFIDKVYTPEEKPEDYTFIQSLVTDNTALMKSDPDYIEQLKALPPKLREAWLYGKWDIFEGQFFEEFIDDPNHYLDRTYTHVIEPFEVPSGWKIYRSFDWGYNKPFSCGWWAVDYDGVAYRILEYYGCKKDSPNEGLRLPPFEVFRNIHKIETEHRWLARKKIIGVADPACWNAESGESIAETAGKCGVYFDKGDHARLSGWMQVHYRLSFDSNGYPMMYVFKNCQSFIRTLPLLQYDEHKPEDLDTDGEDHIADETRYFCMCRPIKPVLPAKRDPYYGHPAHLYLDIPKEDIIASPYPEERMEIKYD